MLTTSSTTTTSGVLWNGPICTTCGARYLGHHKCSHEDITRRVLELLALLNDKPAVDADPMRGCPCRPENGGSGVCGCTMGGPKVTC